jgi:enamine deaminase RidA (YjgF/YER057c/UK114 family)
MLTISAWGAHKKKNEEPKPQVLPLPKELPRALAVDTGVLSFHTTPLLKTGHLSAQIRETISNVIRDSRGATIVKLRAFVAGAGDSRRVHDVVGDMFSEKKLSLPVLTIVQVGGLGDEAAAVVMETVTAERKQVNPNGLVFIGGESDNSLAGSLSKISEKSRTAGLAASDIVSVTCYAARLSDYLGMRESIATAFPHAALNVVQAVRDPLDSRNTCEAIGRIPAGPPQPANAIPPGSRISRVTAQQIVFTGLQLSFGTFLDDADSALTRLSRDAEAVHADLRSAVLVDAFSLNPAASAALQKTLGKYNLPPSAVTVQLVEGLPSLDAALGMEAVLVPAQTSVTKVQTANPRSAL